MGCPSCGTENPAAARFCMGCGAALVAACPACGHANPPVARFCMACGAPLAGAPAPVVLRGQDEPRPYAEVIPPHLAQKILASRAALEGERKQVTVLFADVAGSTELIRDLDPEEAQTLLDGAVTAMMDAVHRYEGIVNHILGDGIMALFGAPIAHEDHAVRACYAALAMQEAVRRYAEEARRRRGSPVHVRIGLNSGEVVVRAIANDLRMDYSAMGQTVHLAARMEQAAAPGSAVLTPATLALAEGYVRVRALGPVPVKGIAEPVEMFELAGAGTIRTRLQASAARGLTRFVGRQAELEAIHMALERVGRGHGQVVALVGEPGVGKSRLVWEITHSHRTHGWTILESGSASYGKATSYLPVIDLLKAYCRIEARNDARTIREKVSGKLLSLDEGLRPALPAFLSLLDVEVEDPRWQALDPPQRRRQTLDALKRLLLRESREHPLLLVFEDLHWIDAETQALLDGLIESLPTARILLLVNYRPEYRHGWGNKTYYTQLRIDPLPPEGADELLESLLGQDPSVEPLKPHLVERTEGNPFFLEESVRALVETGALAGERGAYRLAEPLASVRVPATVQAVLAARIDRLRPGDKRLLQSAAVIGKDVPYALLRAITIGLESSGADEDELQAGLARLQAAEFLYEAGLLPELEYTFKHALTHEVAYGSLLQERRRALHTRIAEAIEQLDPDRLVEHVERLAHHALRGQVWDKAVDYCRQAGHKAVARSAHREAVTYFDQAVAALEHLPDTSQKVEQAIDLRLGRRGALISLGELGRMLDSLHEAETLASSLADQDRLGWVSAFLGQYYWMMGDQEKAIAFSQSALDIAGSIADRGLKALADYFLGAAYVALGDYHRAREYLMRTVAALESQQLHGRFYGMGGHLSVLARNYLVWALAELGAFAEGIARGGEAIRIANEVDNPFDQAAASVGVGLIHVRRGELPKAVSALEHGLEVGQAVSLPFWTPRITAILGYAHALSGRRGEALPLLERAIEGAVSMRFLVFRPLLITCLGETYLLAGRPEDARVSALDALELSRIHEERGNEAWAARLLGEIASQSDPPDVEQAEGHYRQALALAKELGMRPLQAHCHHGLGALFRKTGRPEQARAELAAAVELYRAMEMSFWLPKAEAELARAG